MQELYYVYKTRNGNGFNLIADRGRRLSDIEVDVSIAHQENCPLSSIAWHKVVVNPLEGQISKNLENHIADQRGNKTVTSDNDANQSRKYSQIVAKGEKPARKSMRDNGKKTAINSYVLTESALRWNSILMIGGLLT